MWSSETWVIDAPTEARRSWTQAKTAELGIDVESGAVTEIVIARNGKPAARVVPIREKGATVQFGTCQGEFVIGDDIDASNAEIADMFDPTLAKATAR